MCAFSVGTQTNSLRNFKDSMRHTAQRLERLFFRVSCLILQHCLSMLVCRLFNVCHCFEFLWRSMPGCFVSLQFFLLPSTGWSLCSASFYRYFDLHVESEHVCIHWNTPLCLALFFNWKPCTWNKSSEALSKVTWYYSITQLKERMFAILSRKYHTLPYPDK